MSEETCYGQLSSMMSKQLKVVDSRIKSSTKELDWNYLKRTPQFLKQRIKFGNGSYTSDEEFNYLEKQFKETEKTLQSVEKYVKMYSKSTLTLLDRSTAVGKGYSLLYDPYEDLAKKTGEQSNSQVFEDQYRKWQNVNNYIETINMCKSEIENETKTLAAMVELKIQEIYSNINNIHKKIRVRSYALVDYDKVYNSHDNLLLKQKSGELTVKQSQQLFSSERKLEENKVKFDEINDLLKKELPYFLKLVELILTPLQEYVYYVQLMNYFQFSSRCKSYANFINLDVRIISSPNFADELMTQNSIDSLGAYDSINQLTLINFRDRYLSDITLALEPENRNPILKETNSYYYMAKFNFEGQQEGDLSFKHGDIITVLTRNGNWWKGELDGVVGIFPRNYVEEYSPRD